MTFPQATSAQTFPGGGDPGGGGGSSGGNTSPPTEQLAVSPTGVDIRSGRYAYSATDLQIGGLSLTRTLASNARDHINPFGNLSHNWDIFI
ncbi:MAG: hypothetical protein AAGH53_13965, partial [Pseudomonadota bacterium]